MRLTAEPTQMQFTLVGFKDAAGLRVYAFQGIAADRSRVAFSVSANLALSRTHGIRLQELPLLCLQFLEQRGSSVECHLAFAQEDMQRFTDDRATQLEAGRNRRSRAAKTATASGAAGQSSWANFTVVKPTDSIDLRNKEETR